jgi:hypothetical protein
MELYKEENDYEDDDEDEDDGLLRSGQTYQVKIGGKSDKYEFVDYDFEGEDDSRLYCMYLEHIKTGKKLQIFKWGCFSEYFALIEAHTGRFLELDDLKDPDDGDNCNFDMMYTATNIYEPVELELVARSEKIFDLLISLKQLGMV